MTESDITGGPAPARFEAFSFGDAVPVLDAREIMGYFHSAWNGRWYEPPVSFDGLAKSLTANPHHQSALGCKAMLLASHFRPHRLLSRQDFKRLALDFLIFGNGYIERRRSLLGSTLELRPVPARWVRMGRDGAAVMLVDGQEHELGELLQLQEPDVSQEIYGLPGYLGAMQAAWLNEAATLFRRRYYLNGSHAGFILYLTDASSNQEDVDALKTALKESKGPGNFRNLFMYAPGGKKDGLQVIPIAEVMAKDEFMSMKSVTRDDVLAAHRVPPQLLGMVPANAGGFGSVEQAAQVFFRHEIKPLMTVFEAINDWAGEVVVAFEDYAPVAAAG